MNFAEEHNPYAAPEGLDEIAEVNLSGPRWERPETGVLPSRFLLTIRDVLVSPRETFATMGMNNGYTRPAGFAVLSEVVAVNASGLLAFAAPEFADPEFQEFAELGRHGAAVWGMALAAASAVVAIGVAGLSLISVGYFWCVLFVLRIAGRSYESAFRVACYIYGATAPISMIPYVGNILGGVIALIYCVIVVQIVYSILRARALAVVTLIALPYLAVWSVAAFYGFADA